MDIIEELSSKRLCFTVTSGRSGTKLLAELLRGSAGICAEHEPAPRFNYVLRSVLECPEAARWWLLAEKLPAIARRIEGERVYAELSHLTCKGFIEPLLEIGIRPVFLMISRAPRDVATSLFHIGAIPERTGSGRLVLIGPQFSRHLPLPDWEHLTDYQLCYWYAREIQQRQMHYRSLFENLNIDYANYSFAELSDWTSFRRISKFVFGENIEPDRQKFASILQLNQNPREELLNGAKARVLESDIIDEERHVDELIRLSRLTGKSVKSMKKPGRMICTRPQNAAA